MQPPLRIAILECDTPLAGTQSRYGGYAGVFKALLNSAADSLDNPVLSSTHGLEFSVYDVVEKQEYPSLEEIDAVLLTGSREFNFLFFSFLVRAWMKSILCMYS